MVAELAARGKGIAERQYFRSGKATGAALGAPPLLAASHGSLGTGDGLLHTRHDRIEDLLAHHSCPTGSIPAFILT
jgi:hypothetical protein